MARWRVEGLHQTKGERIAVLIDAASPAQAEQEVGRRGVVVDPSATRRELTEDEAPESVSSDQSVSEFVRSVPVQAQAWYQRYAWGLIVAAMLWPLLCVIGIDLLRISVGATPTIVVLMMGLPSLVLAGLGLVGMADRLGRALLPSSSPSAAHRLRRSSTDGRLTATSLLIYLWFYALLGWGVLALIVRAALAALGASVTTNGVAMALCLLSGLISLVMALIRTAVEFARRQDQLESRMHADDLEIVQRVAVQTPGIQPVHALTRRPGWHEMRHTALAVMLGMWAWTISVVMVGIFVLLVITLIGGWATAIGAAH